MKIHGQSYQTIWEKEDAPGVICIIDQRYLPHELIIAELRSVADAAHAIREMLVRGAPLIGATAAYGLYLATLEAPREAMDFDEFIQDAARQLLQTRPTAVDLHNAIELSLSAILSANCCTACQEKALRAARSFSAASAEGCRRIGEHGLELIRAIAAAKPGQPVNVLTHCNAGWLACIDYGTATAPIYLAHEQGIPVHVWVDETRPRNQGSRLTAFELLEHGIPHTLITDNAGGHLMQHGLVDLVFVGTDRTTRSGDVANKIGTYLKALAASDNGVPFYVALPSSTIDWALRDGLGEIPIEERDPHEVRFIPGWDGSQQREVLIAPPQTPAANYGFDVTPARLVTGLITERGICPASEEGLLGLFPEKRG